MAQEARNSDYVLAQQGNTDIPEFSQDYWLLHQFRRTPFQMYKFWLILNFPIMLLMVLDLVSQWYTDTFLRLFARGSSKPETSVLISFMFFLYGCCQMVYAMRKKKSRIAEEAFLKFQYALISSVSTVVVTVRQKRLKDLSIFHCLLWFYIMISPVVHVGGGFAALGVFKENHPLIKLNNPQALEERSQDFLEQNAAVASEFSK